MDIYASDDEKGEEIKQWWRDNGRSVVVACVVATLAIFSGRYWLEHQNTQSQKASQVYQQVSYALDNEDYATAELAVESLFAEFSDSPYAVFSSFDMASKSVKNNDNASAQTYLNWVINHAKLSTHKELASLRLAQVLLLENKLDEALSLSKASTSIAFSSLWSELQGDIYIALSKPEQAREAYQNSLSKINQGEPRQQILQIKLDDVAVSKNG